MRKNVLVLEEIHTDVFGGQMSGCLQLSNGVLKEKEL